MRRTDPSELDDVVVTMVPESWAAARLVGAAGVAVEPGVSTPRRDPSRRPGGPAWTTAVGTRILTGCGRSTDARARLAPDTAVMPSDSSPRHGAATALSEEARRAARSAYLDASVRGVLDGAAPRLDGGSPWATAARAHVLLHGDGDLDAAHRLLVGAIDGGADPSSEPEALTAALDTLLMVCRIADRKALWLPYRALAARHAAHRPAAPDPTEHDPAELDPTGTVRAGWSLLDVDGVARRGAALRRVLDDGPHSGAVGPAIGAAVLLALDAFAAGRWDDTCRLAGRVQVLCASHGHEALAMLATAGSALVAACRGDEVACHDHTSAMIGWAAPRGAGLVHRQAIHARVLAALGQGDAESAYHLAATITPPGARRDSRPRSTVGHGPRRGGGPYPASGRGCGPRPRGAEGRGLRRVHAVGAARRGCRGARRER